MQQKTRNDEQLHVVKPAMLKGRLADPWAWTLLSDSPRTRMSLSLPTCSTCPSVGHARAEKFACRVRSATDAHLCTHVFQKCAECSQQGRHGASAKVCWSFVLAILVCMVLLTHAAGVVWKIPGVLNPAVAGDAAVVELRTKEVSLWGLASHMRACHSSNSKGLPHLRRLGTVSIRAVELFDILRDECQLEELVMLMEARVVANLQPPEFSSQPSV
eukprot:723777-Amphidinium_carterae.1